MNSETQLWLFAMSVGVSAFGGMLGMASGIFIVPILTIFGHIGIRSRLESVPRARVVGSNKTLFRSATAIFRS